MEQDRCSNHFGKKDPINFLFEERAVAIS